MRANCTVAWDNIFFSFKILEQDTYLLSFVCPTRRRISICIAHIIKRILFRPLTPKLSEKKWGSRFAKIEPDRLDNTFSHLSGLFLFLEPLGLSALTFHPIKIEYTNHERSSNGNGVKRPPMSSEHETEGKRVTSVSRPAKSNERPTARTGY